MQKPSEASKVIVKPEETQVTQEVKHAKESKDEKFAQKKAEKKAKREAKKQKNEEGKV